MAATGKTQATVLQVRVKPRARVSALQRADDGSWLALLKAPPVEGKANAELIALLAEHFQCQKSAVIIQAGASGRTKRVRIEGA